MTAEPPASALSSRGTRVLIVGSGGFAAESGLPAVPAIANTVAELTATFIERCGVLPENIVAHVDPADPAAFGDALVTAATRATDVFVLYYLGHGLIDEDNQLYLATFTTSGESTRLGFDAVSYQSIRTAMRRCRATSILVILDCCYGGRATGSFGPLPADAYTLAPMRSSYVLAAAPPNEQAFAPPESRHTAFSGEFLTLLTEGDPAEPAVITVDGGYRCLRRILVARGLSAPQRWPGDGNAGAIVLAPNAAAPKVLARPWGAETTTADAADRPCPYRGLDPYTVDDEQFFFGRREFVAETLTRMTRLVGAWGPIVVVGVSGVGKSSVVQAGILPAMRRGELDVPGSAAWPHLLITPGAHPLAALRKALAQTLSGGAADTRIVLIVDQFEEVFTECDDEGERAEFISTLCEETRTSTVALIVLRSDFYSPCLRYAPLRDALTERQITVGPLDRPQLRQIIEEPARISGLELEPGVDAADSSPLTDRLLHDLGAGRDVAHASLPLLSYALRETWSRREGAVLTLAGYEATGGIWHAVAQQADAAYSSLDATGRAAAKALLLRMVHVGADTDDTRRRVDLAAIAAERPDQAEAFAAAREALLARRLITVDKDSAQLAHDALLRAWPLLRSWLDEDRRGLLTHQQLVDDARRWQDGGREDGLLYRGSKLMTAHDWAKDPDHGNRLGDVEQQFLNAADRVRLRTRAYALGAAILLLIAVAAGGFATAQRRDAVRQAAQFDSRRLAAMADEIRASDPAGAMQLSLAAYRIAPTAEARAGVLTSNLTPFPVSLTGHGKRVGKVVFSPDEQLLASSGEDTTIRLWDVSESQHPKARAVIRPANVSTIIFVPHSRILVGVSAHTLQLWDVADPDRPAMLSEVAVEVADNDDIFAQAFRVDNNIAVSPDGRTVTFADRLGNILLWDISDPRHPDRAATIQPNPDTGLRMLGFLYFEGLKSATGMGIALTFSPDSRTLVVAVAGIVESWNVADPRHPVPRPTPEVDPMTYLLGVDFNEKGNLLAAAGKGGAVRVWDFTDPDRPVLKCHGPPPDRTERSTTFKIVEFERDAETFMTVDPTGIVDRWRCGFSYGGQTQTMWFVAATKFPDTQSYSVAFGHDARVVATGNGDGTVRVWTSPRPAALQVGPISSSGGNFGMSQRDAIRFGLDGNGMLIGRRLVRMSDPYQPELESELPGAGEGIIATFAPNGRLLLGLPNIRDRDLVLWDATDSEHPIAAGTIRGLSNPAFGPDSRIVAGFDDRGLVLWDISDPRNPRQRATIPMQRGFHPPTFVDPGTLLIDGKDSTQLWDISDADAPNMTFEVRHPPPPLGFDGAEVGAGGAVVVLRYRSFTTPPVAPSAIVVDRRDRRHPVQISSPISDTVATDAHAFGDDVVATARGDGAVVQLWDIADPSNPEPLSTVSAAYVKLLGISQGGQVLTATAADATIRVWDITDPRKPVGLAAVPADPYHEVWDDSVPLTVDAGGTLAYYTNNDTGRIELIDLDVDRAYRHLCSLAQPMSEEQWKRYASGVRYRDPCG
ncbi:caspase family protein [Nocardia sp. NBC_01009]|uniref:caspase, EACC1-associated type n=1 Tax=Nocardia sp. NBC_01009 TaxID=2975996 RepID=UPI00386CD37C|nr:caspase family protein [Nocardia sp. NBC_01009]